MLFKMKEKVGNHSEGGKLYVSGDVVKSTTDLAKKFPGKFEEVEGLKPTPKKVVPKEKVNAPPTNLPEKEEKAPALGRDVTKRFPDAVEEGFLVFGNGGAFTVAEKDEPTVPLNEKPLKRNQVSKFIQDYLKG